MRAVIRLRSRYLAVLSNDGIDTGLSQNGKEIHVLRLPGMDVGSSGCLLSQPVREVNCFSTIAISKRVIEQCVNFKMIE